MRHAARLAALLLALLLLAAGWFGGLHASGNYHEVIAGEIYRSAQRSGAELTRRIRQDGIRSVVNLRGSQTDRGWYDEEIAATRAAGGAHFDLRMSAARHMDRAGAEALVALIRAAPKPVLIHCEGGSDRTGLATALYLAATGHPLDEAGGQLSVRYGFVGIEGVTRAWPMAESWARLGPVIAREGAPVIEAPAAQVVGQAPLPPQAGG